MTVAAILSEKGYDVISAAPDAKLSEICDILATKKIGAIVLIGADEQVAGIISERDVVRAVARAGASALDSPVSEHMTSDVISCKEQDTIIEVMELMTKHRFRHMPITRDDKLVAVISIGDVVKYRIAQAEREAEEMRSYITTV